jgi:hypothetical protein
VLNIRVFFMLMIMNVNCDSISRYVDGTEAFKQVISCDLKLSDLSLSSGF